MTHVAEGTLLAFLDGELSAEERTAVSGHVTRCVECAASLDELRAAALDLTGALGWLDQAAPTEPAYAAVRAAPAPARVIPFRISPEHRGSPVTSARRALLRAAMLVLGLAAGVSAAIPGSPVREWLVGAWNSLTGGEAAPVESAQPEAPPATVEDAGRLASVSVRPEAGGARIELAGTQRSYLVRVRVVDSDRVAVYASGAAADAHFATGPGHVKISDIAGGEIRVDLPRGIGNATVEAEGAVLLEAVGGRLRARAATVEETAGERTFRVGG